MRIWLMLLLVSMVMFDLFVILALDMMGMPPDVNVPILGMTVGQNSIIILILILFPTSVMEMFFIFWIIDRRIWK